MDNILEELQKTGLRLDDLQEAVFEIALVKASEANSEGLQAQMKFIGDNGYGLADVVELLQKR